MNHYKKYTSGFLFLAIAFLSCEDEVSVNLNPSEPVFTVDAWLDNQADTQRIILTRSTDFFNNETLAPGVSGAEVFVTDEDGTRFDFEDRGEGVYRWISPVSDQGFGEIGTAYELSVLVSDRTYTSQTTMRPTASVDTVYFIEDEDPFDGDFIRADFLASDLPTLGDAYWIKAYKNDTFLNKAAEINIAFDAGFTPGGGDEQNGKTFIPPIRFAINNFEDIPDLYEEGDIVRVEIFSLSLEAFDFLNLLVFQSDREAGLSALFEGPLNNVSTNIVASDPEEKVLGIFNVAAVESNERELVNSEVLGKNEKIELEE